MPKKFHQKFYSKPPSTAPPTFASSSTTTTTTRNPHTSSGNSTPKPTTVNDLLAHLRSSQANSQSQSGSPPSLASPITPAQGHSLPPSLSAILGVDPVPPPRPRGRAAIAALSHHRRGIAGPPPPRSWLVAPGPGTGRVISRKDHNGGGRRRHDTNIHHILPGLPKLPGEQGTDGTDDGIERESDGAGTLKGHRSLMHYALLTVARNWDWVQVYEKHYLPGLQPSLKSLLVAYINVYFPSGVAKEGLDTLYPPLPPSKSASNNSIAAPPPLTSWESFSDDDDNYDLSAFAEEPELEDETTHLPLSRSLGKDLHLSCSALERFFCGKKIPTDDPEENRISQQFSFPIMTSGALLTPKIPATLPLRLPNLTHLSLAYPSSTLTSSPTSNLRLWHWLIRLLTHLSPLTHLSLAGWPSPFLPPSLSLPTRFISSHGGTISFTSPAPAGGSSLGGGRDIFAALAKATYCLKTLDVSDWDVDMVMQCFGVWSTSYGVETEDEKQEREVKRKTMWECWRGLEKVVWREGWGAGMPELVTVRSGEQGAVEGNVSEDEEREMESRLAEKIKKWREVKAAEVKRRVTEVRRSVGVGGWVDVVVT